MSTCWGPEVAGGTVAAGGGICGATGGSGSRIRAVKPRPRAFLAIGNYLLSKFKITFRAFTTNVVEDDGLSVAGCLGQANMSRDYGLKDLRAEEAVQVRGYLLGK